MNNFYHYIINIIIMCNCTWGCLYESTRGSNNKLNEVSDNVRNDNRLFDSQNNGETNISDPAISIRIKRDYGRWANDLLVDHKWQRIFPRDPMCQ